MMVDLPLEWESPEPGLWESERRASPFSSLLQTDACCVAIYTSTLVRENLINSLPLRLVVSVTSFTQEV